MKDTKHKILDAALNLFSVKGYDGVSVKDIAEQVGIKDSSLYKHYLSKQEIFDRLVEHMYEEYGKIALSLSVSENIEEVIERYKTISEDDLLKIACGFFLYFAKDERASKFRRILTMEQFRNEKISALYKALYFENVLTYHSIIFKGLIDSGVFIEADPEIVALHFYSPIFLLITSYDEQKINESEALEKLAKHIRQFRKIYNKES